MLISVNVLFQSKYIFFCISSTVIFTAKLKTKTTIPNKIVERLSVSLDSAFIFYAGFQNVLQINTLQKKWLSAIE